MSYWDRRYRMGGTSGKGSQGAEGQEKAKTVSELVAYHGVTSLLDIGCGDGRVAAQYELGSCLYVGVDPSPHAIKLAKARAPHLTFAVLGERLPMDAHLSMDVMFHLIDEKAYHDHLAMLFSARRFVFVYSTDHEEAGAAHVLHRHWTPDVPEEWRQSSVTPVTDRSSFYVYRR